MILTKYLFNPSVWLTEQSVTLRFSCTGSCSCAIKTSTATPGFGSLFAICPYKGIIGLLSKLVPKFGHIPTQNWPEDALVRHFFTKVCT